MVVSEMVSQIPQSPNNVARHSKFTARLLQMGPWDQQLTPDLLAGAPVLPMPVEIAHADSLRPIFRHLQQNGEASALPEEVLMVSRNELTLSQSQEKPYDIPFIEYDKGVIYADRRLDLCKMVLGPPNIENLLDSLETNTFIKHFLLGNNIIGPVGAHRIAKFICDHPERMDTWYLAGNCIDHIGFQPIADGLVKSVATNVWLKRNPLTAHAVPDIAQLICQSQCLRTLDLDQTGLSDAGVAELFTILSNSGPHKHSLQHLYLNGNGIGVEAAIAISRFLKSASCNLKSIYLSNNPLGDAGVSELADALRMNSTIERLMLSSVGLTAQGASKLLRCLAGHESLLSLELGQSFATEDLKTRFNWITDDALPMIKEFVISNITTRYLNLGMTALSTSAANEIRSVAIENHALCWFVLDNINESPNLKNDLRAKALKKRLAQSLARNVAELYHGLDYPTFEAVHKRGLTGHEEDVRKIDSVYRNHDKDLARRGLKILDKWWDDGDTTLERVMKWEQTR